MRIDLLYNLIVYILRKERNGAVTIDDFNQVIPRAQVDAYNDFYNSIPKGQNTHDALAPFKTKYDFTPVLSPSGVVTVPDGYVHLISMNTIVSGSQKTVVFPQEDELADAVSSELRPLSINYPLGDETATGVIQLYPAQGQSGTVWYYREPTTPTYQFTLNGRQIVYDAGSSVDLEFADIYQNKIIGKCLQYFGINLSDQQVFQYGLLKDKESE